MVSYNRFGKPPRTDYAGFKKMCNPIAGVPHETHKIMLQPENPAAGQSDCWFWCEKCELDGGDNILYWMEECRFRYEPINTEDYVLWVYLPDIDRLSICHVDTHFGEEHFSSLAENNTEWVYFFMKNEVL